MGNLKIISARESIAIDVIKSISILSVITMHVVTISDAGVFIKLISSLWSMFGRVGVVSFFIIGGYLYNFSQSDGKVFWKKKFFRIILPWFFCATLTFVVRIILNPSFELMDYVKWVIGSGTWYYYVTIYTFFLLVFTWFCKNDKVLFFFIGLQFLSLMLYSFGFPTTMQGLFLTDYLNPLHWIGYFSAGILIRRYRVDLKLLKNRKITITVSTVALILCAGLQYVLDIYTYFHVVSMVFCVSAFVLIAAFSYRIANMQSATFLSRIGRSSYCIYLLHMQIVQGIIFNLPDSIVKDIFSPVIGLAIMTVLVFVGILICDKLPFGERIKMLVGL